MKYKLIFLLALIISLANNAFAQDKEEIEVDSNKTVYWVNIKVKIKVDKETKRPEYIVKSVGRKPKSGSLKEFEKAVCKKQQKGISFVIGPFFYLRDALNAIIVYNTTLFDGKSRQERTDSIRDPDSTCYWFLLKPSIITCRHPHVWKPAIIFQGSLKEFEETLLKGLVNKAFAIGPFSAKNEAELVRKYYWQYEIKTN